MSISRRDILYGMSALALPAVIGRKKSPSNPDVRGVFEVDIRGYDRILLPREHGQLTASLKPMVRRYPSRDHCMQMAAFFGPQRGLLVFSKDSRGSLADWEIQPNSVLRIHFYGDTPEVDQREIEPSISAAAAIYREWARDQSWVKNRTREARNVDLISVASNPNTTGQRRHLKKLFSLSDRPCGAWFTQWRRFPFDSMYPDYVAAEPDEFASLLRELRSGGHSAFPYVNGMLWDSRFRAFETVGKKVALASSSGAHVRYNSQLAFLKYACPFSPEWREEIVNSRSSIRDSDGDQTAGVYLDMLLAAAPILCWSNEHGHVPGDPDAWRIGVQRLLQNIRGSIFTEGCAEPYLDLVDYALMHLYSREPDTVPLWSMVYGDVIPSVGWSLEPGIDSERFAKEMARAASFGVKGAASPWMTSDPESELLARGIGAVIQARVAGAR